MALLLVFKNAEYSIEIVVPSFVTSWPAMVAFWGPKARLI
jgi:hypothetical protein